MGERENRKVILLGLFQLDSRPRRQPRVGSVPESDEIPVRLQRFRPTGPPLDRLAHFLCLYYLECEWHDWEREQHAHLENIQPTPIRKVPHDGAVFRRGLSDAIDSRDFFQLLAGDGAVERVLGVQVAW